MSQWRLLSYQEFTGAQNMALDQAILDSHIRGDVPPTLRFYGFAPPTVSIGYNQSLPENVERNIEAAGFDIVRRPTGGRAVLHLHDLTYSFVCSSGKDKPLETSVMKAYKQICAALQSGFAELGLSVEMGESDRSYRKLHDCFQATTASDLHYQGKKIVGSAQLRRKDAVLQHGSILLEQEQRLMPQLLMNAEVESDRHANLFELLGRTLLLIEIENALVRGFEEVFSAKLVAGEMNEAEKMAVTNSSSRKITVAGKSSVRTTAKHQLRD